MGMKNIEIKAMYLWTTSKVILDSFQSYDERKRQWKKVARGQKACAYIPMRRPYKVEKDIEKNWEKTSEEFTLFHIQLVAIFHEAQLEGNEWKTLDKTIIENIERVLKEHWLYNVSKEDYVKNVRAFEKWCKQYDDKVQVEEEKKEKEEELEQVEVVEEPKAIEKKKTIEESRREFEEWAREIEKQLAEESLEVVEEEKEQEEIDTTSKDNDPDYWF